MGGDALLGSLTVLSQVDVSQLGSGFAKGEGIIASFVGNVGQSVGGLRRLLDIGAVTAAAFRGLDALDDLAVDAQKIGTTTQALAELQHAAGMTNVETGALQTGLEGLLKKFGEANAGSSSATKAFADIGLELEELKGLTATELFAAVSDELAKIEDPAERAAKGAAIFGKGFSDLVPLIEEGRDGIAELAAEADRMGAVLNDRQTKNVDEANTAWDRFKAATDGATMQLAAALSPAFEALFEVGTMLLTDFLRPLMPILEGVAHVLGFVGKVVASVVGGISALANGIAAAVTSFGAIFDEDLVDDAQRFGKAAGDSVDSVKDLWVASEQAADGTKKLGDSMASAAKSTEKSGSATKMSFLEAMVTGHEFFHETRRGFEQFKFQVEHAVESLTKLAGEFLKTRERFALDVATFGMTPRQREIEELRLRGMDEAHLNELRHLDAVLTKLEEEKRLKDQIAADEKAAAADLAREEKRHAKEREEREKQLEDRAEHFKELIKTDEQKRGEELAEVFGLMVAGKLSAEEYRLNADRIMKDDDGKFGVSDAKNDLPFAAAALVGSQEARDALLRASVGGGDGKMAAVQKNTMDTVAQLQEVNQNLKQNKPKQPTPVKI